MNVISSSLLFIQIFCPIVSSGLVINNKATTLKHFSSEGQFYLNSAIGFLKAWDYIPSYLENSTRITYSNMRSFVASTSSMCGIYVKDNDAIECNALDVNNLFIALDAFETYLYEGECVFI